MRIAATGFVSEQAGSIASANALLLNALLRLGHQVHFFSKASFVDPRPAVNGHPGFQFSDVDNVVPDRMRRRLEKLPLLGSTAGMVDSASYNQLIISRIKEEHRQAPFDICLWLGDYARGDILGLPSVSFVQGAPGSDARSILNRREEVRRMAGQVQYLKWSILARFRLSKLGWPPFSFSKHFIVGSSVSKRLLQDNYRIPGERISLLPYPIDLEHFKPATPPAVAPPGETLKVLWLGRIVPRKRLELFLEGARLAIDQGCDLRLTVVGDIGFIPGYEKLLAGFAHPERLKWIRKMPRAKIPELMQSHDLLCQPSDDEDFGSSVAEAQSCGLPVIVGNTSGNGDYLCERDIHLSDDKPATLATALLSFAKKKVNGQLGEVQISRETALKFFTLEAIATALEAILKQFCL